MSIVAEFTVPVEQFALPSALPARSDVEVAFERVVTHSQEWIMPFLWAKGERLDAFHDAVEADPTVTSVEMTDSFDEAALYRIKWSDEVKAIINAIFDRDGTLVEATGSEETWGLSVRFHSRESFADLRDHFDSEGEEFVVERVYTQMRPRQPEYGLTAKQRDALAAAVDAGYYAVPRQVTLAELAADAEVSPSALSERLRRSVATLGRHALQIGEE